MVKVRLLLHPGVSNHFPARCLPSLRLTPPPGLGQQRTLLPEPGTLGTHDAAAVRASSAEGRGWAGWPCQPEPHLLTHSWRERQALIQPGLTRRGGPKPPGQDQDAGPLESRRMGPVASCSGRPWGGKASPAPSEELPPSPQLADVASRLSGLPHEVRGPALTCGPPRGTRQGAATKPVVVAITFPLGCVDARSMHDASLPGTQAGGREGRMMTRHWLVARGVRPWRVRA